MLAFYRAIAMRTTSVSAIVRAGAPIEREHWIAIMTVAGRHLGMLRPKRVGKAA
jgi:hypothetical protein